MCTGLAEFRIVTVNQFRRECPMADSAVFDSMCDYHTEPGRNTLRHLTFVHVKKLVWFKDCLVNGKYVRIPEHGWVER